MRVPENLQRAMAAEAEAARNARAKVINHDLHALIYHDVVDDNIDNSKEIMNYMPLLIMMWLMIDLKVIAAEGEHKASRALRQATKHTFFFKAILVS